MKRKLVQEEQSLGYIIEVKWHQAAAERVLGHVEQCLLREKEAREHPNSRLEEMVSMVILLAKILAYTRMVNTYVSS